jgi:DNA-binding CsgD family transcriptional regulator
MSQDMPSLTPFQNDVLILLASGLTNREIATRLELTPGRIGTQVGRIVQLLGLTRRADVAARLAELGHSARTGQLGDGAVSAQGPKTPGPWSWHWRSTAFTGSPSAGRLRHTRRELRGPYRLPYRTF